MFDIRELNKLIIICKSFYELWLSSRLYFWIQQNINILEEFFARPNIFKRIESSVIILEKPNLVQERI